MTITSMKIQGTELFADQSRMDATWIAHCVDYGIRRFVNDKYSGEKGQVKIDLCRALIADMQSGEAMPEKVAGVTRASADPITALAVKNAKADLSALFRHVTGANKATDWAEHEKVAPFFTLKDDKATWKEASVKGWMDKQKEDGKRDYMADAKATLDAGETLDVSLDF